MKLNLGYLRNNLISFLIFELIYRVLLIYTLTDGCSRILSFLLRIQGYSYMTAANYKHFLLHPLSLLGILLLAFVLLLMILFELYGLFILMEAGKEKKKVSYVNVLRITVSGLFRFLRRYPVRWALYTLFCLPNLYLQFIIWECTRAKLLPVVAADICSIITIPGFVIFLTLYFLFSVFFTMTLPYRLFLHLNGKDARKLAFRALKGKRLKNFFKNLWIQLSVFIATMAILLLAVVAMVAMVRLTRPVNSYVSLAVFYGSIFRMVMGMIMGFIGTVAVTDHIFRFYRIQGFRCIDWSRITTTVKPEPEKKHRTLSDILCDKEHLITGVLLGLTAVLVVYESIRYIPNTTSNQDYLEIQAHRGGAKFAPENTLSALQYSIDVAADYAEIDVQETKDGEVVLLHDNSLLRTTGVRKNIWDMTYEEIASLDAGSFYSSRYEGEKIPTLREFISASQGKMRLNIEVKANGHNSDIVEKVVSIIEEENFTENCVITSMNYSFLNKVKELNPNLTTGYTLSMIYGSLSHFEAADFFSVKYTYINRNFVNRAHKLGKNVCAWTVNSRGSIRKVINCGVDTVITDNPELVRKEILGENQYRPRFISMVRYAFSL